VTNDICQIKEGSYIAGNARYEMHSARNSVVRSALIGSMFCVTYFVTPY
jgi:hypothetical protein